MRNKKIVIERIPISEWPELDRQGAIINRMTIDPPPSRIHLVTTNLETE